MADLLAIADVRTARVLLHPLRMRLLVLAREPASATEMASRLKLPRQKVNYHVLELARRGLLKPAGRRRKRNMIEQRYEAAAIWFLLAPGLAGDLAPDWRAAKDPAAAAYLLGLCGQMESDLLDSQHAAEKAGRPLPVFAFKSQFRFRSQEESRAFTAALRQAVIEVIARHTSPDRSAVAGQGEPPHRLILGCYPYVTAEPSPA